MSSATLNTEKEFRMKKILSGVLFGALVFGFAMNLSAEESSFFACQDNVPNLGISFLSTEATNSTISPNTAGWLNLIFGLGSFMMGDVGGGISVLAFHTIGWGAFIVGVATGDLGAQNIAHEDPDTGLGNTLVIVSGTAIALGIVWGFIRPHFYQRRIDENRTARLNDLRNWDIAVAPTGNGNLRSQIAFTAHF